MRHIDLFSGVGGFALACQWAGIETIAFCEIDEFCQRVLCKHWPDVPIVGDINNVEEIKQVLANASRGRCQQCDTTKRSVSEFGTGDILLTAGFPCQPFSNAGRKRGTADDRYLWPQTLAVIEVVRPDWVLLENVPGILSMVFPDSGVDVENQASFCAIPDNQIADYDTISGRIDYDLQQAGYETVWLLIPACGLGAPHRRNRVWIVGRANVDDSTGCRRRVLHSENIGQGDGQTDSPFDSNSHATDTNGTGNRTPAWSENWYEVATRFCRMDARIPDRVDRLRALGNAIVPQVAFEIIKAIKQAEPEI